MTALRNVQMFMRRHPEWILWAYAGMVFILAWHLIDVVGRACK